MPAPKKTYRMAFKAVTHIYFDVEAGSFEEAKMLAYKALNEREPDKVVDGQEHLDEEACMGG